jgi:hypothetical protein
MWVHMEAWDTASIANFLSKNRALLGSSLAILRAHPGRNLAMLTGDITLRALAAAHTTRSERSHGHASLV